jgi:transcriptional regulator with XRE-family HTH domain
MGRGRRPRPKKLHKKLAEIRKDLAITQEEMAKRLIKNGAEKTTSSGAIADFETGKREPSLLVLLAYARLASVSTDVLIDDRFNMTGG